MLSCPDIASNTNRLFGHTPCCLLPSYLSQLQQLALLIAEHGRQLHDHNYCSSCKATCSCSAIKLISRPTHGWRPGQQTTQSTVRLHAIIYRFGMQLCKFGTQTCLLYASSQLWCSTWSSSMQHPSSRNLIGMLRAAFWTRITDSPCVYSAHHGLESPPITSTSIY